jgi:hypothetical protein
MALDGSLWRSPGTFAVSAKLPFSARKNCPAKYRYMGVSMANCYFAKPQGMQHCYIPFFMLLISNALLVLARHRAKSSQSGTVRSGYR